MQTMAKPGFTKGNAYLFDPNIWCWNLPSGFTCPGAKACLAYANKDTGKITLGKHNEFKCYSAVTERFPAVRAKSWANRDLVFGLDPISVANAITALMPANAKLIRIHAAGDFFSQEYFDGWLEACRRKPHVKFWAFTKSLPFWIARIDQIPPNLNLTASIGGKHDGLVAEHRLRYARVVYSPAEAEALALEIDSGDRLAAFGLMPFALLENFGSKRKASLPMAV
jgi:hypothetical protein